MKRLILLADDSLTIQRVIELTFADEDINVVAVSDGDQAIDRLKSAPPDIVLADIGKDIWIEEHTTVRTSMIQTGPRIGVESAGKDALLPYRFVLKL